MRAPAFSEDQQDVLDAVLAWRARGPRGADLALTLGGYAGTGKTTLVAFLAGHWPDTAVAAVYGKAAHVLRSKGVDAQTVHSLIYVPVRTAGGAVRFRKRSSLDGVRTLIIDEASMIGRELLADLLSFRIPILFVGDHGQLEPIGVSANLMANPQLRLEKIHRQAENNPILGLATAFREGRTAPRWEDPEDRLSVLGRREFEGQVSTEVQILCGFNRTRHRVNARVRGMMGLGDELVVPGERLICLQNNKTWNVFNGQQVTVAGVVHEARRVTHLEIETDDGRALTLPCLNEQFGRDPMKDFRDKEIVLMDYGYCLTVHKAQGSDWGRVLVLEEIARSWDARRWRYTAVTRAKERLIYCS